MTGRRTQNGRSYLDPAVLSKINRLDLIARLVVEGFITGLHKSPFHGFSVEFSEYRPYMTGDSIKDIDWKVLGRTERFYVKRFQEETNVRAHLIVDGSGSMTFGSGDVSKLQYAKYLAAALAWMLIRQRDAAGLVTFDKAVRTFMPPRSAPGYLHVILSEIEKLTGRGETQVASTFHDLAERITRRSLIIVLSDLLDSQQEVMRALKHFRHRKHEVIVFHILDPLELDFNLRGNVEVRDMESHNAVSVETLYLRKSYKEKVEQFIHAYRKECREHRIDYNLLRTDTLYSDALTAYMVKRSRMGV